MVAETRALIEAEGLEALSLRRLAERLGVTAPALYAHVEGKDDLLRAVTDQELDRIIDNLQPTNGDPVECLRHFCRDYVAYALAHPNLYRAVCTHPPWRGLVGTLVGGGAAAEGPASGRDSFTVAVRTSRFRAIYDTVVEAVDSGAFRPVEPLLGLLVLWTAVHGLVEVLLLDVVPDPSVGARLSEELIDTTIAGLRPRPPEPATHQ